MTECSELIKRLRAMSKVSAVLTVLLPNSDGNAMVRLLDEAADAIEELSKPRWISVEERLPEDDTHVLGWDGKRVRFVYVVTDLVFYAFAGKEGITHWMPLPSTEGLNET